MRNQGPISISLWGECFVWIIPTDSGIVVKWTDGIAQEEIENYSSLALALARVAALAKCGENKWGSGFLQADADTFSVVAESFLAEVVK